MPERLVAHFVPTGLIRFLVNFCHSYDVFVFVLSEPVGF